MESSDSSRTGSLSFLSSRGKTLADYPALKEYSSAQDPFLEINNEVQRLRLAANLEQYHFVDQLQKNPNMQTFFEYFLSQKNEHRKLVDELGWYIKQLENDQQSAQQLLRSGQRAQNECAKAQVFECLLLQKCQLINSVLDSRPNAVCERKADGCEASSVVSAVQKLRQHYSRVNSELSCTQLELDDLRSRVGAFVSQAVSQRRQLSPAPFAPTSASGAALRARE